MGQRPLEVEALGHVAAHLLQESHMPLSLHPLRYDLHPQGVGQLNYHPRYSRILSVLSEALDEGLVYLEDVRR